MAWNKEKNALLLLNYVRSPIGGVLIRNGRKKKAENVDVSLKVPVIPKEAFVEFSYVSRQTIFLKLILLIQFLFTPSRLQKIFFFF